MLIHTAAEKDARGFAAVDQRVVASIELQAKLAGALNEVQVNHTTNIAIMEVPGRDADQTTDDSDCMTIDIDSASIP